ncbi:MAG: ABC transporter substrate-binding protein [Synergistaceae bacterium]|nr:ABC transporter substrate-binding protein [Synergistaceae bacterium]
MKRLLVVSILVVMLVSVFTCFAAGAANVVKIGVFQAMSGNNGAGGKQQNGGLEFAHYENPTVVIGGQMYAVELVYADNQSSTAVAPSAAQTLVAAGVSIVLGSYGSAVSIAASDVFGDARIPAIGMTNTNPQVTLGNDHYFRLVYLDPFQGSVLAKLSKDRFKAKKAYVLAMQGDDYSVGLAHYFREAFGPDNCFYEVFPEGTSDFSSYVATAKAQGADVFMSPTSTEAAALIIDQAHTQALGIPILAGDTWDANVILNAAKGKNVNINVTTFYQEGGSPEFDAGFKKYLNANPAALANNGGNDKVSAGPAVAYDGYYVALEALKKAGSTEPAKVLEALRTTTLNGVTGPIAFDKIGDCIRDTAFVKKCNTETGAWEFVAQQSAE